MTSTQFSGFWTPSPLVYILARSIRLNPCNLPYYVCISLTPLPPQCRRHLSMAPKQNLWWFSPHVSAYGAELHAVLNQTTSLTAPPPSLLVQCRCNFNMVLLLNERRSLVCNRFCIPTLITFRCLFYNILFILIHSDHFLVITNYFSWNTWLVVVDNATIDAGVE